MSGQHPVLFIVGFHGSGKTTLGRALKDAHGWRQLSVGDLARLGRRGKMPQEVSLRLMVALAHSKPGHHMDASTASLLLAQVDAWRRDAPVVVDGFPSLPEHLCRLPKKSGIVQATCAEGLRETRLLMRSERTQRKWTPGAHSARDMALDEFVTLAKRRAGFIEINNSGGLDALGHHACHIDGWARTLS